MVIETLVATVVAALVPYFKKGAEEFAASVGKDVYEKVKGIVAAIQGKRARDEELDNVYSLTEKKPDAYGDLLRSVLAERLKADPAFASELEKLVATLGPVVNVQQWMNKAEGVIGAAVGTMGGGTLNVGQTFTEAKDVVGAKIDKLG